MASTLTLEMLSTLPEPSLVETLNFEAILQRRKDIFVLAAQARGLDVGQFINLESSTETILLEEASYSEMLWRSRLNVMYRAGLLYYATGTVLDHIAEWHGVNRLVGEKDEDLRDRVRVKNRGSSSAGPDDWWRYHAQTADARVEDVAITRNDFPFPSPSQKRGKIIAHVLARTEDGVPPADLLEIVRAKLLSRAVRGVTTDVEVIASASQTFNVAADIWLMPDASDSIFDGLEASFRATFAKSRSLGWDVTSSWLNAQFQKAGVHKVNLLAPTSDIACAPHQSAKIGTVTLTLKGRAF